MEKFAVKKNFARYGVYAEDEQVFSVGSGGCEPDLTVDRDGAGPSSSVDGGFPCNVLCFAPACWKAGVTCGSVVARAPVIRPSYLCENLGGDRKGGQKNDKERRLLLHESFMICAKSKRGNWFSCDLRLEPWGRSLEPRSFCETPNLLARNWRWFHALPFL